MTAAKGGKRVSERRKWASTLAHGTTSASYVAIFTGGGYWLDSKQETLPLFTLIGFAIGVTGAMYEAWKLLKALDRD